MNFATDLTVFAAEQGDRQAREEHNLMGSARYALRRYGKDGWYETLLARAEGLLRATYRREARRRTSDALTEHIDVFIAQSTRMLEKTSKPTRDTLESQARTISASLSTGAINAAMEAAGWDDDTPNVDLEKVWVAMDDEKVRATHHDADGQAVPLDRSFDVGGHKLRRPGDTSAPIEEWANCRCLMAVRPREEAQAVTAAAERETGRSLPEGNTGVGIFAVAAAGDPIYDVSTEDPPHVTTIWLGKQGEDFTGDVEAIKDALDSVVKGVAPFEVEVRGRESLGDEDADVLMLNPGTLGDLRDDALTYDAIRLPYEAAEQFPEWIPHMTLGYPDTPAKSDDLPETITIDRLGLWVADEQFEFPLNGEAQDMDPEKDQQQQEKPPPLPEDQRLALAEPTQWHGVLAPENISSGDGRKFTAGALRRRPLPQPLKWQKADEQGHGGSITVARIDAEVRVGNEIRATGYFLSSVPESDEAIGLIAEGGIRGVSIDADDGRMEMQTSDGQRIEDLMELLEPEGEGIDLDDIVSVFTTARIAGATLCPIPAFHQAWVALGPPPEGFMDGEDLREESLEDQQEAAAMAASGLIQMAISEKPWDGSASRFTDEEWKRSCTVHLADTLNKSDHKLPIKEPNGDLSRAGVHAAAGRVSQVDAPEDKISSARAQIRSAYKTLGEEPPETLASAAEEFVKTEDGPGWITHPVDTDRLRDYWTKGPGGAEIAWGTPGDFNRCRALTAEYVKPQHLNGYCANRHYDALGFWPSSHKASAEALAASAATDLPEETMAPALRLVASGPPTKAPMEWFENPNLLGPSPVVITENGRIFGHLAAWGTCHIGIDGLCREAPPSRSDYAHFKTGSYVTDKGTIPIGVLTYDTGHADLGLRARPAMAHYDNTGSQSAYVNIGEDEYGIWVAGVTSPRLDEEDLIEIRASALSGDWREIGGDLELVAALHVNTPGFPIPHTSLAASGGHQTALVAAGIVPRPTGKAGITVEEIVAATLEAMDRRESAKQMAAIASERSKAAMAALAARRTGE